MLYAGMRVGGCWTKKRTMSKSDNIGQKGLGIFLEKIEQIGPGSLKCFFKIHIFLENLEIHRFLWNSNRPVYINLTDKI